MSHLTFGVLGAAKIADRYTIAAMLATEGVGVAGIAARSPERAEEMAAKFGIATFPSYRDVIESDEVTAVYIPLPIGLHAEWAIAALEAGKHVLCEKSLAGNYADCLRIIEIARERDLALIENFMCETHPQNLYVRDALAEGTIGVVRNASLSFGFPPFPREDLRNSAALEGGALNDAGAYCLDMAVFYSGRRPVSITSVWAHEDYEVDITGSSMLVFDDGSTSMLAYGFDHDYRNEARFWGSEGQLEIDRAFSIPADRLPAVSHVKNTVRTAIELPSANQFESQIARFASLVDGAGRAQALDRLEAHATLMHAARVSASERRTVELGEFDGWSPLADSIWTAR